MKKYLIPALVISMSVFTSCAEWIDETRYTPAISSTTFYNTPEEANAAVMAPLNTMRLSYDSNWYTTLETDTEYCISKGLYTSYNQNYNGLLDATHRNRCQSNWTNLYKAILQCNMGIKYIPESDVMTEDEINMYIGELRFLRGLNYFNMVRRWGGLPLRTEENMEEWSLAKSSADEVYEFIVEDLKFAMANCPDTPRMIATPGVNAAKAVLAEVYMFTENYGEAERLAGEVIESSAYSLVGVASVRDFDKVFGYDLVTSTEEVFYIKTSRTDNLTWGYPVFAAHPEYNIEPDKPMLGSTCYFTHYSVTDNGLVTEWAQDWDPNTQVGDFRYDFNLRHFVFGADAYGPNTMLFTKFWDPNSAGGGANCSIPLVRFTDVMITYAEATARVAGAPTSTSIEMINQMRRRAHGLDYRTPSAIDYKLSDYGTMDEFIDLLIKEETYERMNEGKHWDLTVRLGKAAELVKKYENKDIKARHYLWMIPDNEFLYNAALDQSVDQNPGYTTD